MIEVKAEHGPLLDKHGARGGQQQREVGTDVALLGGSQAWQKGSWNGHESHAERKRQMRSRGAMADALLAWAPPFSLASTLWQQGTLSQHDEASAMAAGSPAGQGQDARSANADVTWWKHAEVVWFQGPQAVREVLVYAQSTGNLPLILRIWPPPQDPVATCHRGGHCPAQQPRPHLARTGNRRCTGDQG